MRLGDRSGYRISAPLVWRQEPIAVTVAPFYEFSRIGESETAANSTLAPTPGTAIQEPSSETRQLGIELLLTATLL
jgi:hypothetical protein